MPDMSGVDPSVLYSMFKGEPGTRKSTAALSFPLPQYWFSWDRKMEGMMLPMSKWGLDPKKIQFDDYDNWNAARDKLEKMTVGTPGDLPYKTIIFDSITSMADMTLRQALKAKRGTTRSSGAAAGKNIAGIAVSEIEDYLAESSAIQELVALSKDILKFHRVNIILIAHVVQAEYKNTITGETHVSRTIITAGKKVGPKIPAYCGEVYHFNVEAGGLGGKYGLLTEHSGDDFARTGLPLPRKIVFGDDPLYAKYILPAINNLKTEVSKPPIISIVRPPSTPSIA